MGSWQELRDARNSEEGSTRDLGLPGLDAPGGPLCAPSCQRLWGAPATSHLPPENTLWEAPRPPPHGMRSTAAPRSWVALPSRRRAEPESRGVALGEPAGATADTSWPPPRLRASPGDTSWFRGSFRLPGTSGKAILPPASAQWTLMDSPLASAPRGSHLALASRPRSVRPCPIRAITVSLKTGHRGPSTLQGVRPAFRDSPRGHISAPGEAQGRGSLPRLKRFL